jgi:hypothetical protein
MNEAVDPKKVIVVAGDLTMDWHLACDRPERHWPGGKEVWNADHHTFTWCQRGGVGLLAELIRQVAGEMKQECQVWETAQGEKPVLPCAPQFPNSFAIWKQHPYSTDDQHQVKDHKVWRVSEFLGLTPAKGFTPKGELDAFPEAFLVVLDDASLGFRNDENRWAWLKAIIERPGQSPRPWVILKMASPVADGALWNYLRQHHAERLVVVVPINDVCRPEVQISRELSWESTALDLIRELTHEPRLNGLCRSAYVVITFEMAGALLMEGRTWPPKYQLFFDPKRVEGMWERQYPGKMIGYNTCLTASLAAQIMRNPDKPDIVTGIQRGLAASRLLHLEGYDNLAPDGEPVRLTYPFQRLAKELAQGTAQKERPKESPGSKPFATLEIPPQVGDPSTWSIMQEIFTGYLEQLGGEIVLEGTQEKLSQIPVGEFGKLLTVDRQEIESLRNVRNLIHDYYCHRERTEPLSLAVFGPPGAGKSFGIKQVAASFKQRQVPIEPKEFNLSQFQGPGDLIGAFHQVRDLSLKGKMPLVFWDEFDTTLGVNEWGWLQYFLAPMQDGTFVEGQITHPIGRAIFIFAGGTSRTFKDFRGKGEEEDTQEKFAKAKGPDFISRLKGYVNVLGPNPREVNPEGRPTPDQFYLIRRAILLRSLLERHWPHLLEKPKGKEIAIDPGVLRAFLCTTTYKHGTRSLEAIVATSRLSGKESFERSALPPVDQLELHADARDFMGLVQQPRLPEKVVKKLAPRVHEIYFTCNPDEPNQEKDYEKLTRDYQESNLGFVRNIPRILATLGAYILMPKLAWEGVLQFSEEENELLAEMEHQRWLEEKIAFGWRYGELRDDKNKIHPALLPWRPLSEEARKALSPLKAWAFKDVGDQALPEKEKDKDRCMVRAIPELLDEAGYTIIKP